MSPFSKRLKAALESSSLSAAEIEEKLGLEAGSIDRWINRDEIPDTPTVNALAAELGVSANSLLFGVQNLGEMKAMFPDDKTAAPSPFGNWKFFLGLILIFTGLAGALLLFMRVTGVGYEGSIWDAMGLPLAILGGIALIGILMCVWVSVKALHISKKKKNTKDQG